MGARDENNEEVEKEEEKEGRRERGKVDAK